MYSVVMQRKSDLLLLLLLLESSRKEREKEKGSFIPPHTTQFGWFVRSFPFCFILLHRLTNQRRSERATSGSFSMRPPPSSLFVRSLDRSSIFVSCLTQQRWNCSCRARLGRSLNRNRRLTLVETLIPISLPSQSSYQYRYEVLPD